VANFVDDLASCYRNVSEIVQILRIGLRGAKEEYHFQFIWYSGQCVGEA
jgi:hypothetical protein